MVWFCNEFEFDDILIALETEADSEQIAGELLSMIENGKTWDQIWVELGILDQ